MVTINISGDVRSELLFKAAETAEGWNSTELDVNVKKGRLYESATPVEVTGVVCGIAGICSLILQITKDISHWREAKRWTAEKLRSKVNDEMFRLGVSEFHIDIIKNFDALLSRTGGICYIEADDSTNGHIYKIYISVDGEAWSLRIR